MADDTIAAGQVSPMQRRRVRKDGLTKTRRRRFLAVLAETCNVRMAAETAGASQTGFYDLRRRDPEFADLWQKALEQGYQRLEEALLQHALTTINAITVGEPSGSIRDGVDDDVAEASKGDGTGDEEARIALPIAPVQSTKRATPSPAAWSPSQVQIALSILGRHQASVAKRVPMMRGGRRRTPAETDVVLRRQLDLLAQRLAKARTGTAVVDGGADGGGGDDGNGGSAATTQERAR